MSDKNPERKIIKIRNKENKLKSLLNKIINDIKKNPALNGTLKEDIVNFLCLEKCVLSNKILLFIIISLKPIVKMINKKK
tara:strand:- start:465 stop:704 length:240 start_codon:yes stop_codon:yes gene_type:complete